MDRRVVVTGLGAITPLGNDVDTMWNNLVDGKLGIDRITLFDATDFAVQIAAEVKDFDPKDYMEKAEIRRSDRNVQMGLAAAVQAVEDSGIEGISNRKEPASILDPASAVLRHLKMFSRSIWPRDPDSYLHTSFR